MGSEDTRGAGGCSNTQVPEGAAPGSRAEARTAGRGSVRDTTGASGGSDAQVCRRDGWPCMRQAHASDGMTSHTTRWSGRDEGGVMRALISTGLCEPNR